MPVPKCWSNFHQASLSTFLDASMQCESPWRPCHSKLPSCHTHFVHLCLQVWQVSPNPTPLLAKLFGVFSLGSNSSMGTESMRNASAAQHPPHSLRKCCCLLHKGSPHLARTIPCIQSNCSRGMIYEHDPSKSWAHSGRIWRPKRLKAIANPSSEKVWILPAASLFSSNPLGKIQPPRKSHLSNVWGAVSSCICSPQHLWDCYGFVAHRQKEPPGNHQSWFQQWTRKKIPRLISKFAAFWNRACLHGEQAPKLSPLQWLQADRLTEPAQRTHEKI